MMTLESKHVATFVTYNKLVVFWVNLILNKWESSYSVFVVIYVWKIYILLLGERVPYINTNCVIKLKDLYFRAFETTESKEMRREF